MATNVEALKDLYVKAGGSATDVADVETSAGMIEKLGDVIGGGSGGGLQKVKTVVGSNKKNVTIDANTQKSLGLSGLSFYDADNDLAPLDNLPDYDLAIIKKIQLPNNLTGVVVSQYDIEKDVFFVDLKNFGSASQTLTENAFQIVAMLLKAS